MACSKTRSPQPAEWRPQKLAGPGEGVVETEASGRVSMQIPENKVGGVFYEIKRKAEKSKTCVRICVFYQKRYVCVCVMQKNCGFI